MDTAPDVGGADENMAWAARVQRLEAELAGLRRAMRGRAVIEQAKGLLAGTLGISTDAAFNHLSRLSQHENLRLVEVAARIIGAAVPVDLPEPASGETAGPHVMDPTTYLPTGEDGPPLTGEDSPGAADPTVDADLPAVLRVRLQTAMAAVRSARSPAELAERLLADGLAELGASAAFICVLEPTGAVRLAGAAGLPAQVAADWQWIPSPVPTAVRDAIRRGQPLWWQVEPGIAYVPIGPGTGRATYPLTAGDRSAACLEIVWPDAVRLPEDERRYLDGLVGYAERRMAELIRRGATPPADPRYWLQAALEAVPLPLMLLAPVRDEAGDVVDFVIDYAGARAGDPYAQDPETLTGARLLDVRPYLAMSGVFDAYRTTLRTGTPWQRTREEETVLVRGQPRRVVLSRSAVRVGAGLLVCWQEHETELAVERAGILERLGRVGYAEWDLAGGAGTWTPGTYQIFERSPTQGPLPLGQLPVLPEDLPDLQADLRRLLVDGDPLDTQFRIATGSATRTIRLLGEPAPALDGPPTVLRAVVQDITGLVVRAEAQRAAGRAAAIRRVHRGGNGRPG